MKAVGVKVLKNKLSEYVRLAESGETVLVTDRDRVVAELGPPRPGGPAARRRAPRRGRARGLADRAPVVAEGPPRGSRSRRGPSSSRELDADRGDR